MIAATPEALTVTVTARDLTRALVFPDLRFEVRRYGFQVEGGPKQATIRAYGNELALRALFNGLRGQVDIWDSAGQRVWWGCLWSVTIQAGALTYGRTLDGMANSVNISYLQQSINETYSSSGTQTDTGFLDDAASIAEFGRFALTLRGGNGSAAAANARRQTELTNRRNPQQLFDLSPTPDEGYADLVALSWVQTLDRRYYTNSSGAVAGIEQNAVITSEAQQFLGRAHPALTTITFGKDGVLSRAVNTGGTWAISNLAPYNHIYFSGAANAGNNATARLVTAANAPGMDYTFGAPDFVAEAAGASVYTLDVGTRIRQTFQLSTNHNFEAAAIDLRLQIVGAPTDSVEVAIIQVSPVLELGVATISYSEIPSAMDWVTGVFPTPVPLTYGTAYLLEVRRTVVTADLNCYLVGVDQALSYVNGAMTVRVAAGTYITRNVDADLIFKISGVIETTTQITDLIAAVGEFITSVRVDNASGVKVLAYQDGTLTGLQVLSDLAAYGTSNNRRLLYKVTPERVLTLYEEPVYNTTADVLVESDGQPRSTNQQPIPAHRCPYGQWVEFAPLIFYPNDEKFFFVDEAEYDALRGTWRPIRLRERSSDLDLTRVVE